MSHHQFKQRMIKIGMACVVVLTAALGIVKCGHVAGEQLGEASIERLQLVWPEVLTFSDGEKLLLAELALECRLTEAPAVAPAVLTCLDNAAAVRESKDSESNARAELRKLMRKSQPAK